MSQNILFSVGFAEIIARVVDRTVDKMVVAYPMMLRPVNTDQGIRLDMYPYSLGAPESDHTFNSSTIISTSTDIPKMLEEAYIQRTSGLVIASAVDAFASL